jgi:hypothetical protein
MSSFRARAPIPSNPDAKVPQKSAQLASIKLIDYDVHWAADQRQALLQAFETRVARAPLSLSVTQRAGLS